MVLLLQYGVVVDIFMCEAICFQTRFVAKKSEFCCNCVRSVVQSRIFGVCVGRPCLFLIRKSDYCNHVIVLGSLLKATKSQKVLEYKLALMMGWKYKYACAILQI